MRFKELADVSGFHKTALTYGMDTTEQVQVGVTDKGADVRRRRPDPAPETLRIQDAIRDDVLFRAFAKRLDINVLINDPITDNERLVARDAVQ